MLVVEDNDESQIDNEAIPKIVFSNAQSSKLFGANFDLPINTDLGDNLS